MVNCQDGLLGPGPKFHKNFARAQDFRENFAGPKRLKWLPKAMRPLSNTAAKTLHNRQSKSLHGVNFSAVKQNKVEDNRKDQRGEYTLQHNRCSRSR